MGVKEYVSVPTKIEAIQFDGKNWPDVVAFTGTIVLSSGLTVPAFNRAGIFLQLNLLGQKKESQVAELWVAANNAWVYVETGEWIIGDHKGFYPCKDEMFTAKYREADGA